MYAAERRQGTAPGGAHGVSATVDQHPDVRRMLSSMRAALDAMRLVVYTIAIESDRASSASGAAEREHAQDMVDLLTPVAKAWVTDLGVEITSLGIQVLGGVGYSEEMRAAQRWRDSRIGPIYEGTNGIQAIDLVTRKLPRHHGALVESLLGEIDRTAGKLAGLGPGGAQAAQHLGDATGAVRSTLHWFLEVLGEDPERALAGATPFLGLFGDVIGGWLLAGRALVRSG